MTKPTLIAVGGLSGAGKSVLAASLAAELPDTTVLRSDVERKAMFRIAENSRLPAEAYTAEASARVYAVLVAKAYGLISIGKSVVVDAVSRLPTERAALEHAASGATFHGLFLATDLATRIERVSARKGDVSDANEAIARIQEKYDLGEMNWHVIDASGDPADTLRRARAALGLEEAPEPQKSA